MLLSFDIYTLTLITLLNLVLTAGSLLFISVGGRRAAGFWQCAFGYLLVCFGFLLVPLRLIVSLKVVLLLPNLLIPGGDLLILQGVRAFRGQASLSGRVLAPLSLLYVCAYSYWLYGDENLGLRVAVVMPFYAAMSLSAARSMMCQTPPEERGAYWLAGLSFVAHALVLLARAVGALLTPTTENPLDPHNTVELVHLVALNWSFITCAFALAMATNMKLRREVEALAFYDPLTQLPNRRLFEKRLAEAMDRASGNGQRVALVYSDLNQFKQINDDLGHEAGDEALRTAARRLATVVRSGDCLARLGGDEFVLVMEDVPCVEDIDALILRLDAALGEEFVLAEQRTTLSASCGYAVFPDQAKSIAELIGKADRAMYRNKQERRQFEERDRGRGRLALTATGMANQILS